MAFSFSIQAQSDSLRLETPDFPPDSLLDQVAQSICECTKDLLKPVNPQLLRYLEMRSEEGEDKANEYFARYLKGLNDSQKQRLMQDVRYLRDLKQHPLFRACLEMIARENPEWQKPEGVNYYLQARLYEALRRQKNCRLAQIILQL